MMPGPGAGYPHGDRLIGSQQLPSHASFAQHPRSPRQGHSVTELARASGSEPLPSENALSTSKYCGPCLLTDNRELIEACEGG
jgi:hypothetical protein